MTQFKNYMSIGKLAHRIGVPRQRIYNLVKRGVLIPELVGGTCVFSPAYAALILEAVVYVNTKAGTQVRFDFI